jgi:hypothetical protein
MIFWFMAGHTIRHRAFFRPSSQCAQDRILVHVFMDRGFEFTIIAMSTADLLFR